MAVILVITAVILIMLIRAVVVTEEVTVTLQVKNDVGFPVAGAAIVFDGQKVATTDSNGFYAYTYPADKRGESRLVRAEMAGFDPAETRLSLTGKRDLITLELQRTFATLTIVATDSLTGMPLSGVEVFLGNDRIDTTDASGRIVIPSHKVRVQDTPVIKLEKKKYLARLEYPFIDSKEQSLTVAMAKSEAPPPVEQPKKKTFPMAFKVIEPPPPPPPKKAEVVETNAVQGNAPPQTDLPSESLPHDTVARADEAMVHMMDGRYRQALEIYRDLINQRQWQARADFWLYGADCALHMASDANASYNEAIIDSALTFLDEAERYQNKIAEDLFPAVVQMKKGEAWAYKCELPSARNTARLQEYRQKARYYLRSSINMMKNKGLDTTDVYRLTVEMRDEVENR